METDGPAGADVAPGGLPVLVGSPDEPVLDGPAPPQPGAERSATIETPIKVSLFIVISRPRPAEIGRMLRTRPPNARRVPSGGRPDCYRNNEAFARFARAK